MINGHSIIQLTKLGLYNNINGPSNENSDIQLMNYILSILQERLYMENVKQMIQREDDVTLSHFEVWSPYILE